MMHCRLCGGTLQWEDEGTLYCLDCCEYEYLDPEDEQHTVDILEELHEDDEPEDEEAYDEPEDESSYRPGGPHRIPLGSSTLTPISCEDPNYEQCTEVRPDARYSLLLRMSRDRQLVPLSGSSYDIVFDVQVKLRSLPVAPIESHRRYVIVLDHSRSMHGRNLNMVKQVVFEIVSSLSARDHIGIVSLTDGHRLADCLPASEETKFEILAKIRELEARGNTDVWAGLTAGYQTLAGEFRKAGDEAGMCILVTDGQVSLGERNPTKVAQIVEEWRSKHGVRTEVIGIGNRLNQQLLSDIARTGGGLFRRLEPMQEFRELWVNGPLPAMPILIQALRLEIQAPFAGNGSAAEVIGDPKVFALTYTPTQIIGGTTCSLELGPLWLSTTKLVLAHVSIPAKYVQQTVGVRARVVWIANEVTRATNWVEMMFTYVDHMRTMKEKPSDLIANRIALALRAEAETERIPNKSRTETRPFNNFV